MNSTVSGVRSEQDAWDGEVESLLLDQIDAAVIALDLEGNVTHWSAHAEKLYGRSREETLGRPVGSIGFAAPVEDPDAVIDQLRQGRSWQGDVELLRKDGTRFLAFVKDAPLRCPSGNLIGFVGVSVDVTERRRAENELRRRNADLLRMARLTSWEWDLNTDLMTFSDAGGEPPSSLHGTFEELLAARVHSDDRELARRTLDSTVRSRRSSEFEFKGLTLEGDLRYVTCFAEVEVDASGEAVRVWGTSQDVTEQREGARALRGSELARRRLLGQLVRAQDEERSRLAADIHDDAIQVLHAAVLRAEALSALLEGPEQQEAVERLEESLRGAVGNLRKIVAGVRQPALDAGELVPSLASYLQEATTDWAVRYSVDSRLGSEPIPEVRAVLFRIVVEAIVNARKHSGAETLSVTLEREDGGVRVEVSDDGSGFTTGESAPADTGHWGLATMKERAESCGGRVRVESQPGEGTTVTTWIPDRR
jgi:PAS domain S-box-containing protein